MHSLWRRIAVVVLVLALLAGAGVLALAVKANHDRAEDWRQRAIATQANRLAGKLRATRSALQRSEGDVSSLTQRQRELANEKARVEDERRQLQAQQAALVSVASGFIDCSDGLFAVLDAVLDENWNWVSIYGRDRISSCADANSSLDSYRARFG
jgi:small-conductance mechanosensitive channel